MDRHPMDPTIIAALIGAGGAIVAALIVRHPRDGEPSDRLDNRVVGSTTIGPEANGADKQASPAVEGCGGPQNDDCSAADWVVLLPVAIVLLAAGRGILTSSNAVEAFCWVIGAGAVMAGFYVVLRQAEKQGPK